MAETNASTASTTASNRAQSTNHRSVRTTLRRLTLGSGAILAMVAMVLHPHAGDHPYESIAASADTWLAVHIVLFGAFIALGIGTFLLADRLTGRISTVGKVASVAFTVFYGGYVAMVGLSSALIVRAGSGLSSAEQAGIDAALVYLLEEPAIMAVAGIGTLAYLIALGAIAIGLRRVGVSVVALVLPFGAIVALGVHSGPIAVAGMTAFLAGIAWIEYAIE